MSTVLSIIIVSYNTAELTQQTIKSVMDDSSASSVLKERTEIIVVDNNSQDETVRKLQPFVKNNSLILVENPDNPGFGVANNQGLAKASGKYLLFLNSDTIVQVGALESMVKAFEDRPVNEATAELRSHHGELDKLGILAATLINKDGSVQAQGGAFPSLLSLSSHLLMLDDIPLIGRLFPSTQYTGHNARSINQNDLVPQDWVGGTAMMVRRQVIDEVGGFDPGIFMYAEDVELCMRAQAHHWDVALHPQAKIIHLGSASSSSANAVLGELKGYLYIWAKHKPLWQMPFVKGIIYIGSMIRIFIFGTMLGQSAKATVYRRVLREVK